MEEASSSDLDTSALWSTHVGLLMLRCSNKNNLPIEEQLVENGFFFIMMRQCTVFS